MRIPRLAALWAVVAIVLAACTGGGASPSASAGGSGGDNCLQGRRVVEQLRAAALGCH